MSLKQGGKSDIVDVARRARVSISTVSRSFNHPDLVNPATRKKIERAVQALGYIRNRAAQTMHGRRSGTIGLIVPTIDHAIFAEVVQSFSDAVDQAGFTLLIASHGFDLDREYAVLRKFLEHRVDGVALIGLDHSEPTFQLLEQQVVPVISIWNYVSDSRISCVGAENYNAGRMAADFLLDLGHKRIALIFPNTIGNDRARGRLAGAMEVLERRGAQPPEEWTIQAPYNIAEAKDACGLLFDLLERPSAVLCGNDVIAQGAIFSLLKRGLSVPDDVSVIGIGDFKGSKEMEPALTTIHFPANEIGGLAGREMCQLIIQSEGTGADTALIRTKCDISLSIRETCRAV
jgi:LacI family transcriptional regulator